MSEATKGAMRSAKILKEMFNRYFLKYCGVKDVFHDGAAKEWAVVIDQETGLPELLAVANRAIWEGENLVDKGASEELVEMARVAITKVERL